MVELLAVAAIVVLALAAEMLHAARVRHLAKLAFGPSGRPAAWARFAGPLRVAAVAALAWGLATLLLLDPKVHRSDKEIPEHEMRHLLLLLDVSPSMRLVDAGPDGKHSRRQRVKDLANSLFERVGIRQYLITVVATYNGAIPVVEKTRDAEVISNILDDLPLQYAFEAGGTDLFAGLKEAARIARPWAPRSATLVLLTDGDSVPATGMPKMPASVAHSLVIGVGNPRRGKFIDGRQSKQEASALRQIALRLGGIYHDGNEKHLSTDVIREITQAADASPLARLTRREYALAACGTGAGVLALLPLLLQQFASRWRPGVPAKRISAEAITAHAPRRSTRKARFEGKLTPV